MTMNKNQQKMKATLEALNIMIQHASEGPSGFWTEDHEGCGNPKIFPEFEVGLTKGNLVQKEHLICPWNTNILYGNPKGTIQTGCYYSCSIEKARYLSEKMLRDVLLRFRKRLVDGDYDGKDTIFPLLTPGEINYIEKQQVNAQKRQERKEAEKRMARLKKAFSLIQKYPEYEDLFSVYYGENVVSMDYDGFIDFNPNYQDIEGAGNLSYNEYIEAQIKTFRNIKPTNKIKGLFAQCYYNIPITFKAHIEKINKEKGHICLNRIIVDGMFPDGECFTGTEEHVWMNLNNFKNFDVGDCVSFTAEIYRYVKKSNGKQIDFGLRNPIEITQIPPYNVPSDKELLKQSLSDIKCESCHLSEYCNHTTCMF